MKWEGVIETIARVVRTMSWKDTARKLRREAYTLYFAVRDPRVPWYAKCAGAVVAYVFSPIDPSPDFIPVVGLLDEMIVVLGVMLVRRLIPAPVLEDCRARAATFDAKPKSWVGAILVVALWLALAGMGGVLVWRWLF